MSADAAASEFHEKSIKGISASAGSAVVVGYLCQFGHLPDYAGAALTAAAAALPAAIVYHRASRQRDDNQDIARIQRGELRRPIGLVVVLFVAAILLLDSIGGAILGVITGAAEASGNPIGAGTGFLLALITMVAVAVAAFFVASYAGHYLGAHLYAWILVSIAIVFGIRVVLLTVILGPGHEQLPAAVIGNVVSHVVYVGACLAGAWFGRRNHAAFLANKARRMQQKLPHTSVAPAYSSPQPSPDGPPPPNPRDRRLE